MAAVFKNGEMVLNGWLVVRALIWYFVKMVLWGSGL